MLNMRERIGIMIDDGLDDSAMALVWAAGLRTTMDTLDAVKAMIKVPFADGAAEYMLDPDIGLFHISRSMSYVDAIGRHRLKKVAVPMYRVRYLMDSRLEFLRAGKSDFSIHDMMRSGVFRMIDGCNDYIDVTRAIELVTDDASEGFDLNIGAAVRFSEILSSAVYKACMFGQDAAGLLSSLPTFDESLVGLVLYPEEFAVQAMLARL